MAKGFCLKENLKIRKKCQIVLSGGLIRRFSFFGRLKFLLKKNRIYNKVEHFKNKKAKALYSLPPGCPPGLCLRSTERIVEYTAPLHPKLNGTLLHL